jgi:hypothetical protein
MDRDCQDKKRGKGGNGEEESRKLLLVLFLFPFAPSKKLFEKSRRDY